MPWGRVILADTYSVCLARGRDYVLPMSPLIETCDQWHLSELADRWDGSIVSVAVLRRDLVSLIDHPLTRPKLNASDLGQLNQSGESYL
jgi:hypothetical protein